jgi:hypothetical protein
LAVASTRRTSECPNCLDRELLRPNAESSSTAHRRGTTSRKKKKCG